MNQFVFGRPVVPAKPVADGARDLFVLGAYPSALHVKWRLPHDLGLIRAIAVDNEPEPFWNGDQEEAYFRLWKEAVSFQPAWGEVEMCPQFNGPSGKWVENHILEPLGTKREDSWITDCLDTYYESEGASDRLDEAELMAAMKKLGIPERRHDPHPSEDCIVKKALERHQPRLMAELDVANPQIVVTLGNAALRVFAALIDDGGSRIQKLDAGDGYGDVVSVAVRGRNFKWLPLAHPAAPEVYKKAHAKWELAVRR